MISLRINADARSSLQDDSTWNAAFTNSIRALRAATLDWIQKRILNYLEAAPPAIEHQNGSGQTFAVSCALIHGFGLDQGTALEWLRIYNLKCEPPWNEAELAHKVADAERATNAYGYEYLLYPDRRYLTAGTEDERNQLAALRGFSRRAIDWAVDRGVLRFTRWHGMACYAVTDWSRMVLELRRLDGALFPSFGALKARKSHATRNSRKSWPVGLLEAAECELIALAEGIPDFIALHDWIIRERAWTWAAPVAMLSGNVAIADDALPFFAGRHVRLFPQHDAVGRRHVARLAQQLTDAGAVVDLFDVYEASGRCDGVKDLCDFTTWATAHGYAARLFT